MSYRLSLLEKAIRLRGSEREFYKAAMLFVFICITTALS